MPGTLQIAVLTAVLFVGLVTLNGLTGCEGRSTNSTVKGAGQTAEPGEIPASEQRPGDPLAGRDAFLNRAILSCGLPDSAYRTSTGDPEPRYALPGRQGRNADLPYALTASTTPSGVELVTSNCLACHAAPLNGELVLGLGNEFLDFTGDLVATVEAAGAFVETDAEAEEWRRWADRMTLVSPWLFTDTIGANPAIALTLALMAHRDPVTLAWSDTPLIEPPPREVLPVSVPPLWNVDKKHAMFYNGEGRGDHVRTMILASTTCTDSVEEARAIDAWFQDVRAYLATLPAPSYPFAIDRALAAQGKPVFEEHCEKCHGRYGDPEDYPNLLIALDKVGTDPELALQAYRDGERFARWFESSFYGERGQARPALGYVAPPLDGVWATAPYLHNGSVPTLADLLDSNRRPDVWRYAVRDDRTGGADTLETNEVRPDYDPEAVGWQYQALDQSRDPTAPLQRQKWIYDTHRWGFSNQGHTYADKLDPDQRRALLEYLKTL